jgi:hypothetical protein
MTLTLDDGMCLPAQSRRPDAAEMYVRAGVRLAVATLEDVVEFKSVAWPDCDISNIELESTGEIQTDRVPEARADTIMDARFTNRPGAAGETRSVVGVERSDS